MNAKVGIALAVVFTIVWIGFKMTRPKEVRDGIFYDIVTKQCRELARQAVGKLREERPFTR